MDLVVDQVVQLQHVHVADGDRVGVRLAGATVEQSDLAVGTHHVFTVGVGPDTAQQTFDLVGFSTVEHGGGGLGIRLHIEHFLGEHLGPLRVTLDLPAVLGQPAEVDFHDLADVHTTGHAVGVEDNIDGGAVGEERHVFDR